MVNFKQSERSKDLLKINIAIQNHTTGFCRIFEIEGVERSLYGYLIFTHCGVINTCGEMPSLLRKQNSKTKWFFLVKKTDQSIIWDIRWRIVHQTELLGLSYSTFQVG